MKTSRENNAMEHLRSRTTATWNAAPSYMWLQALTNLHPRLCGVIPPAHIATRGLHPGKHYAPSEAARAYPHAYYQVATIGPLSHSSTPCVLCGKGDNCVDHWMRHCIVLPLTLALLIGARALQGIEQIAQQSQHGLALATQIIFQLRRTIHEKGGLNQVPPAHPEPNSPCYTSHLQTNCWCSGCLPSHRNYTAPPDYLSTTTCTGMHTPPAKCSNTAIPPASCRAAASLPRHHSPARAAVRCYCPHH